MRAVAKFSCAGYVKGSDFDRAWHPIGEKEKTAQRGLSEEDKEMMLRVHAALNKQKTNE